MAKRTIEGTTVTAAQAAAYGYPQICRTEHLQKITPHKGKVVLVKSVEEVNPREIILRDKGRKRRTVPINSIKTITVNTALAEKIQAQAK